MTLLERFDKYGMGASLDEIDPEKIREAIAIAQAFDEQIEADGIGSLLRSIRNRAEELLRGEGKP